LIRSERMVSFFLLMPFLFPVSETPPSERPYLFVQKLHQCRVLFDFNDASAELKGKQIKAQALHELLEYVTTQRSGIITDNLYPEVVNMVGSGVVPPLSYDSNATRSSQPTFFDQYPRPSTQ
jgi:serine/threonine-protein phosphatase 2A regulatory subunit B'